MKPFRTDDWPRVYNRPKNVRPHHLRAAGYHESMLPMTRWTEAHEWCGERCVNSNGVSSYVWFGTVVFFQRLEDRDDFKKAFVTNEN